MKARPRLSLSRRARLVLAWGYVTIACAATATAVWATAGIEPGSGLSLGGVAVNCAG